MARNEQDDPVRLHEAAVKIVRTLVEAGHIAYFAGGCVRDQIMGRVPTDYDVATDAPPEKVQQLFRVTRAVGEAFGVVMVRSSGMWVEVATFRREWGYADHRHPDYVAYSDAEHDAQRRDFTINGLFYDPLKNQIIDYVQGRADIAGKVVRAIGAAHQRFEEDYLRMLRAVRFAARFNFRIDEATAEAITQHAPHLSKISRERIGMELQIMLEHPQRAHAAKLMQELGLDAPALKEDNSQREPVLLRVLPERVMFPAALAAWIIDRHLHPQLAGSAAKLAEALRQIKVVQIVRRWREALTLSNEVRDSVDSLLKTLPVALNWFELDVPRRKRLLARHDWPAVHTLLGAAMVLMPEGSFNLGRFELESAQMLEAGVAPDPVVTGDDLIAAGLVPGPRFKKILDDVYDAQLAGTIDNAQQGIALARRLAAE